MTCRKKGNCKLFHAQPNWMCFKIRQIILPLFYLDPLFIFFRQKEYLFLVAQRNEMKWRFIQSPKWHRVDNWNPDVPNPDVWKLKANLPISCVIIVLNMDANCIRQPCCASLDWFRLKSYDFKMAKRSRLASGFWTIEYDN